MKNMSKHRIIVRVIHALSWWIDRTDAVARAIRAQDFREVRLRHAEALRIIIRETVRNW